MSLIESAFAAIGIASIKAAPRKPKTVLIVEDNADVAALLQDVVEGAGHRPVVVADGLRALQILGLKSPPIGDPLNADLVLLDVMLPDLDGYGVLRALQASREHQAIPVVVMTAHWQVQHVFAGAGGVYASLGKPFDVGVVTATLASALSAGASA